MRKITVANGNGELLAFGYANLGAHVYGQRGKGVANVAHSASAFASN